MSASLGGVLSTLALLVTAAALVCGGLAYARTRQIGTALPILLDLLTAAGLLRLSDPDVTGRSLLTAATIIAVRKLALVGFHAADAGRRH